MTTIHTPETFYIVSAINEASGQLFPSANPRRYSSFEQARAVAYKLSEQTSGSFVVLEAAFLTRPVGVAGIYMSNAA